MGMMDDMKGKAQGAFDNAKDDIDMDKARDLAAQHGITLDEAKDRLRQMHAKKQDDNQE